MQRKKLCFMCGAYFDVGSQSKDFCGATCRKRYERARKRGKAPRRGLNKVITAEDVFKPELVEPDPVTLVFSNADVLAASDGVCLECYERIDAGGPCASGWLLPLEAGGKPVLENRVPLHVACKDRWEARNANGRARKARIAGKRRDA
ncbi:MAG: hypothetical protein K2I40_05105 [Bifidobacterium castoris]|nr:hypothetical protein [Bifidobacterium castoris]